MLTKIILTGESQIFGMDGLCVVKGGFGGSTSEKTFRTPQNPVIFYRRLRKKSVLRHNQRIAEYSCITTTLMPIAVKCSFE